MSIGDELLHGLGCVGFEKTVWSGAKLEVARVIVRALLLDLFCNPSIRPNNKVYVLLVLVLVFVLLPILLNSFLLLQRDRVDANTVLFETGENQLKINHP